MDKVRELRQRARNCRVQAAKASSDAARHHYAELARMWEKLADERLMFFADPARAAREPGSGKHPSRPLTESFWAEMSACEHFVQIYETNDVFMTALSGFIRDGLVRGESAIVIATPQHREELDRRLAQMGLDLDSAKRSDRYALLDAQATLDSFMSEGWPDEERFGRAILGVVRRVARDGRKVRAFGEMVALLWEQGHCAATERLERLWQQLCLSESIALYCAYPKSGFTDHPARSMARVCAAHSQAFVA